MTMFYPQIPIPTRSLSTAARVARQAARGSAANEGSAASKRCVIILRDVGPLCPPPLPRWSLHPPIMQPSTRLHFHNGYPTQP